MRFSRKNLGIPYMLFLILFVIAPLAVLFYYAINVVLETVAVTSIIVLSNFEPFCRFLVQLSAGMSAPGMFNLFIGVMLALLAVLGIVYFFVTERILRRHLNLE